MLLFVILAVFIGGLMVGRTPEYLGKKIEAREIKLATLGALYMPFAVLITTARRRHGTRQEVDLFRRPAGILRVLLRVHVAGQQQRLGVRRLHRVRAARDPETQVPSASLSPTCSAVLDDFVRFVPIIFVLAVAGSLASKKISPAGPGTLRTDKPTFVVLLIGVVVLVGALTFLPTLLLGPMVQSLTTELF